MDTLSHALWGKGLFGYRGYSKLAIFFGAMPDLFSFGLLIILQLFKGNYNYSGPPTLDTIPVWLFFNYDLFHSFFIAFLFIGIVYYIKKPLVFPMLAWPFHIVLDFPFHSKEYFPTKIIWPISDFSIDGIPWSNPEVWFPNLAGLILLYIYRFRESFNSKNG